MSLRAGITRLLTGLGSSRVPGGVVLLYHRVAKLESDPFSLAVSPDHFREHLKVLVDRTTVLPLSDMLRAIRRRALPDDAVAITFDDGYADNLLHAAPALAEQGLPATVFIVSGAVGPTEEFWWDQLEKLILGPRVLPDRCTLDLAPEPFDRCLGRAATYEEEDRRRDRGTPPWQADPASRLGFFHALWATLQPLPAPTQRRTLDALAAWSGVDPTPRSSHLPLTEDEMRTLGGEGRIEIGSHTVSHALLPAHDPARQMEEIQGAKAHLEALVGSEVSSFSYPYGSQSPKTVEIVRRSGFALGCLAAPGRVEYGSDLFQLPRFEVRNWTGDAFASRLEAWLGGRPDAPALETR